MENILKRAHVHMKTLSGLVDQVPAEARPGIERALSAANRGIETALQRLGSAPPAGPPATPPAGPPGGAPPAGPPPGVPAGPPGGLPGKP